jgi:hypothetical protein
MKPLKTTGYAVIYYKTIGNYANPAGEKIDIYSIADYPDNKLLEIRKTLHGDAFRRIVKVEIREIKS